MNNSGLRKVNTGRFDRGRGTAQRTARGQLKFILVDCSALNPSFPEALNKTKNGAKKLSDAKGMSRQNEPLYEKQMGYIDGIYETLMKAMGFPGCSRKHDNVRKV